MADTGKKNAPSAVSAASDHDTADTAAAGGTQSAAAPMAAHVNKAIIGWPAQSSPPAAVIYDLQPLNVCMFHTMRDMADFALVEQQEFVAVFEFKDPDAPYPERIRVSFVLNGSAVTTPLGSVMQERISAFAKKRIAIERKMDKIDLERLQPTATTQADLKAIDRGQCIRYWVRALFVPVQSVVDARRRSVQSHFWFTRSIGGKVVHLGIDKQLEGLVNEKNGFVTLQWRLYVTKQFMDDKAAEEIAASVEGAAGDADVYEAEGQAKQEFMEPMMPRG